MRVAVSAILSASLCVAGCSGGCSRSGAKEGPVVAEGGGVVVTAAELKAKLDEQPTQLRARYTLLERKKELVETLLRFELLAQEARRRGLDKDPEVLSTLKKIAVQKLVRQSFDEGNDMQVSAGDARKYYDEHRDEFVKPERIRAQLVWLDAPAGSPQRAGRAAEAKRLLARLRADEPKNPLAFSNVARESSQDAPTRAAGGDMGYRTQEELATQYSKELAVAAFGLATVGQTSELVETPKGLALLKLTARQPAVNRTFDEVKDQLVARAARDKRTKDFEEYVKGLRNEASITIHDAELEKIAVVGASGVEAARATQGAPAPTEAGRAISPETGAAK